MAQCPKCNKHYIKSTGALSRRDNKTMICSNCGTVEALEDWRKILDAKGRENTRGATKTYSS